MDRQAEPGLAVHVISDNLATAGFWPTRAALHSTYSSCILRRAMAQTGTLVPTCRLLMSLGGTG